MPGMRVNCVVVEKFVGDGNIYDLLGGKIENIRLDQNVYRLQCRTSVHALRKREKSTLKSAIAHLLSPCIGVKGSGRICLIIGITSLDDDTPNALLMKPLTIVLVKIVDGLETRAHNDIDRLLCRVRRNPVEILGWSRDLGVLKVRTHLFTAVRKHC